MTRRPAVALAVLTTTAALGATSAPALAETATVVRAVDGNTVRVVAAGRTRNVDLLGVRAPLAGDCFSAGARRVVARLLPRGASVVLQADPRRPGRARYVLRGRRLVNAAVLRAGAGEAARLSGLRRAAALRAAADLAEERGRGMFGCEFEDDELDAETGAPVAPAPGTAPAQRPGAPAPAAPPAPAPAAQPGAVENANAVRAALVGKQLFDISSTSRSSQKNTTRFCANNRADRIEDFTGEGSFFRNELTGSWNVLGTTRQADGTLVAQVAFFADDPSFDQRTTTVTVAPDGTVRAPGANASEMQAGGECSAAAPQGGFDNDTPAARQSAASKLTGKRLQDAASSDFCSATRVVRRESGAVVLDGSWTVEWAGSAAEGVGAIVALTDARGAANRRLLVIVPASGQPQVRDLGTVDSDLATGSLSAVSC